MEATCGIFGGVGRLANRAWLVSTDSVNVIWRTVSIASAVPTTTPRHHNTVAALDIATGQVAASCKPRHRSSEYLTFLKQVARAYPSQELHLIADNYATHKTPEVKAWLADNPRIAVHYTPRSASWLNLVEVWFGVIQRQAIGRGVFTSVTDLTTKIRAFINGRHVRATPFVWTKTQEILEKATRKTTSNANY